MSAKESLPCPAVRACLGVQAPGYTKIVTRPMAFSIMWERFRKSEYMTWEELQADLNQMFRNAMTYNRPETVFHKQASCLGLPSPLPANLKEAV